MSQETIPAAAREASDAVDEMSTRRPPRGAWLIRAAAVVYLVATAIIAYLVFAAV